MVVKCHLIVVTPFYSSLVIFHDSRRPSSLFHGGMETQSQGMWKALLEDGSCPLIFLCHRELFVFVRQSSSFREQSTGAYWSHQYLFLLFNYQLYFHFISLAGDLHQYRLLTRFPVPTKEGLPPRRENIVILPLFDSIKENGQGCIMTLYYIGPYPRLLSSLLVTRSSGEPIGTGRYTTSPLTLSTETYKVVWFFRTDSPKGARCRALYNFTCSSPLCWKSRWIRVKRQGGGGRAVPLICLDCYSWDKHVPWTDQKISSRCHAARYRHNSWGWFAASCWKNSIMRWKSVR